MRSSAFTHKKVQIHHEGILRSTLFGSMPVKGRKMDLFLRCVYLQFLHLHTHADINTGIINRALSMPVFMGRS